MTKRLLSLLAVPLLLSGCNGEATAPEPSPGPGPEPSASAEPLVGELRITVRSGEGSTHVYEVDCSTALPLCETIAADKLAPPAGNVACTEQYGGPQKATIRGVIAGDQVALQLSRTNGCEISRWETFSQAFMASHLSPGLPEWDPKV